MAGTKRTIKRRMRPYGVQRREAWSDELRLTVSEFAGDRFREMKLDMPFDVAVQLHKHLQHYFRDEQLRHQQQVNRIEGMLRHG